LTNSLSESQPGLAARRGGWDAEGKLDTLTETGTVKGDYIYTADGDRLLRKEGNTTTAYLPDFELTATGTTTTAIRYYTFAGKTIATRTTTGASGVNTLVADHHGTAEIAINNSTNQATRRYHDPYGNPRGTTTPWIDDKGFLGKPTDTTGLTHIGARYYDPQIGRFITVDPIMKMLDPEQWNGYVYSNNNPATFSDPTGLEYCGSSTCAQSFERNHRTGKGVITNNRTGHKQVVDIPVSKKPDSSGKDAASKAGAGGTALSKLGDYVRNQLPDPMSEKISIPGMEAPAQYTNDPAYWNARNKLLGGARGWRALLGGMLDFIEVVTDSPVGRRALKALGPVGFVATGIYYMEDTDGAVLLSFAQTTIESGLSTAGAAVGGWIGLQAGGIVGTATGSPHLGTAVGGLSTLVLSGLGSYHGGDLGAKVNSEIVEPFWRRNNWTEW
jgi:RHS repeat-associated protein